MVKSRRGVDSESFGMERVLADLSVRDIGIEYVYKFSAERAAS
jgi:hypothetical protein